MKIILIIQFIISFSVLVFVLTFTYQQVYALKEYVNDEYNIRFHYPEEWMQISQTISKEFEVEYDKIYLPELWMEVKLNDYKNMQIILYTDMPNLKSAIINIYFQDPFTELSFNLDYILFAKNGIGYAIKYVSSPQNTDKYLNNVLNITNQIMSNIWR